MTRRHRFLFLVIGAVILTVLALVLVEAFRPPSTLPHDRIANLKTFMTRAEAEETIGMPPGDYTTRRTAGLPKAEEHQMIWVFDEGTLLLNFDISGKMGQVVTENASPESLWQRLRRRVGL